MLVPLILLLNLEPLLNWIILGWSYSNHASEIELKAWECVKAFPSLLAAIYLVSSTNTFLAKVLLAKFALFQLELLPIFSGL